MNCCWNVGGYDDYPVSCVTWQQASNYCVWADGRLPSEVEWKVEIVARSGAQDITYSWGDLLPLLWCGQDEAERVQFLRLRPE